MPAQPAQLLGGLRIAVGVGALVAPGAVGKLFGLDAKANPQLPYMSRLFGVRDVVLALGTATTQGPSRATWWQLGIATDATDAISGYLAGRSGSLSKTSAAMVTLTALSAVGLGVAALAADSGE